MIVSIGHISFLTIRPWHLRWFYGVMRKMFGKDLTPVKLRMRLPGIVWGNIAMEADTGSVPPSWRYFAARGGQVFRRQKENCSEDFSNY